MSRSLLCLQKDKTFFPSIEFQSTCLVLLLPFHCQSVWWSFVRWLTFESVDEIVWCHHSNESSLPVLSHDAICFSQFWKMKFGNLVETCLWPHLAVKGLRTILKYWNCFLSCVAKDGKDGGHGLKHEKVVPTSSRFKFQACENQPQFCGYCSLMKFVW